MNVVAQLTNQNVLHCPCGVNGTGLHVKVLTIAVSAISKHSSHSVAHTPDSCIHHLQHERFLSTIFNPHQLRKLHAHYAPLIHAACLNSCTLLHTHVHVYTHICCTYTEN